MRYILLLTAFIAVVWAKGIIEVYGTSTLHDWTMTSNAVAVHMKEENNTLKALQVSLAIESLKSGDETMDNNAYEAFKVDRKSPITFTLIAQKKDGSLEGLITIGERETKVVVKPDSIENGVIKGSFKTKMSLFAVEPPTFFFGMLNTGDEIEIKYTVSE
jgi:hypothetical protein